jgi:hypothetical protein
LPARYEGSEFKISDKNPRFWIKAGHFDLLEAPNPSKNTDRPLVEGWLADCYKVRGAFRFDQSYRLVSFPI